MSTTEIEKIAKEYISWDPNEETKAEINQLLESNDTTALHKVLGSRLQFGTAGLRGPMGAGYNRMNEIVILQTTQGIVAYLNSLDKESKNKGIVIGYDHRKLGSLSSKGFALISAATCLSMGYKVYLLENFVATPFVAYAVTLLNCAAGFMITASHNPKQDNGFKVYWENGAQIIPPHDTNIANHIDKNLKPMSEFCHSKTKALSDESSVYGFLKDSEVAKQGILEDVTALVTDSYFAEISKKVEYSSEFYEKSTIRAVYTAMHGVGSTWITKAISTFNQKTLIHFLPSQCTPDPDFPTVNYPNPEEKGALELSMREVVKLMQGKKEGQMLILANDPDADRLAAAEMLKPGEGGSVDLSETDLKRFWHVFSGNELGILLGHWQILRWQREQRKLNNLEQASQSKKTKTRATPAGNNPVQAAVLTTVVSSRMLKEIAKVENIHYQDTLTGFKWIGSCAIGLKEKGFKILFSYEEALGYCCGDMICDKDGISALVSFVELACALSAGEIQNGVWLLPEELEKSGDTEKYKCSVYDHLKSLYAKYGEFISYNSYVISPSSDVTAAVFKRIREGNNGSYFNTAAGVQVTSIKDVTKGYDSTTVNNISTLPVTPDSEMIMFEFDNGCSVTLRASGTEPKIKYYTEIAGAPGQASEELGHLLTTFVDKLVNETLEPEKNGLKRA